MLTSELESIAENFEVEEEGESLDYDRLTF